MRGGLSLDERGERIVVALAALWVLVTALRIRFVAGAWVPALDDAYIHSAFARQWAERVHWGMSATSVEGESSPGFALLLSLAELGPLGAAPQFAMLLGLVAYALLPVGVLRLWPQPGRVALIAGMLVACGGTLLFHAQSGMETLPFLSLGCAALVMFRRGHWRRAGILAGLCAWLRLDAWALWLALLVGAVDDARARGLGWPAALGEIANRFYPGLLIAGAAPLWLSVVGGGFPPATLSGRRWLVQVDPHWSPGGIGEGVGRFLRDWLRAISAQFGFGSASAHWFGDAAWVAWLRALWKLCAASVLLTGVVQLLRRSSARARDAAMRLFVLWALCTVLQYLLLLPARGHAGRYQPQILLAYLLLIAAAWPIFWRRGLLRPAWLLVVAGVLVGGAESVRLTPEASAHLQRVHARAAEEIQLQPGECVAAFDVGIWAYRRDERWVDLSGLADSRATDAIVARELPGFLLRQGATHVLLPLMAGDGPGSLRDRLGLGEMEQPMQLERSWESPDARWGEAFQWSGNALRRLVLYRL